MTAGRRSCRWMRWAHWSVFNVDRRLGRLTMSITARSKFKKNALYGVYLNSTSLERLGKCWQVDPFLVTPYILCS